MVDYNSKYSATKTRIILERASIMIGKEISDCRGERREGKEEGGWGMGDGKRGRGRREREREEGEGGGIERQRTGEGRGGDGEMGRGTEGQRVRSEG